LLLGFPPLKCAPIQYCEKSKRLPVRLSCVRAGLELGENARIKLEAGVTACEIDHRMRRRSTKACGTLGVLAIAVLLPASSAESQIPKTVESPYAAPSDQALVVFSRPRRRQASETTFRIVSQAGRCLAVLNDGWQMAAPMWPGKHMVMVITGTAPPTIQLVQLKLSGGKTYVVNLRSRVNMKSPVKIEVVRRSGQPLEAFPATVRELAPAKPDLRQCTEWVSWKRSKIEPRAEQAKGKWDEDTDEHRDAHTVRRNDGWTAAEVREP
jgi:hypothetical protein